MLCSSLLYLYSQLMKCIWCKITCNRPRLYPFKNVIFSKCVCIIPFNVFYILSTLQLFVQYLWSMWALKNLARHRWTAIGINVPVVRTCYIGQSTTWSITGLYRAPIAGTRAIIFKIKHRTFSSSIHLPQLIVTKKCVHFMQNSGFFIPLVICNSVQYDSDSITRALVAPMQAVCIYLN